QRFQPNFDPFLPLTKACRALKYSRPWAMRTQNERTTTLSRDTYFFYYEDGAGPAPPSREAPGEPEQRGRGLCAIGGPAPVAQPGDSVADSIRQTQQLDQLQRDYESRLAKLEERSQARFQSAAGQFSAAVNRVESKFIDREAPPPCCQAEKEAVRQCYAANVRYPLRCSQMVAALSSASPNSAGHS
uniref:CHCHD6 n=1 Tax=Macrostomum lignano TaxID=282301 RepID=A0A1I8F4C0_9PLAT